MTIETRESISVSPRTVSRIWQGILEGCDTRAELAERMHLHKMTVGRAVRFLCAQSLVAERETRTLRGNPVRKLSVSEEPRYLILFMGKEGDEAILTDGAGKELFRCTFSEEDPMETGDRIDSCLGRAMGMVGLTAFSRKISGIVLLLEEKGENTVLSADRFDGIFLGGEGEISTICRALNQRRILRIFEKTLTKV